MNGILIIDKPEGITSFDVIRRIRPALGEKRVGHLGTLDPIATGVLPLCVGEATKIAQFLADRDKEYDAEVVLGEARDTQDRTGTVTATGDVGGVTQAAIEQALTTFVGEIAQIPPMHSAISIGGERLYKRARRGEVVERAPRQITIHAIRLLRWVSPRLFLHVHCSTGTYVRTLAQDLGERLGCFVHLSALRRTRVGPFRIESAIPLDRVLKQIEASGRTMLAQQLIDLSQALGELAELRLDPARERKALKGQPLTESDLSELNAPVFASGSHLRLTGADHRLVAIGRAFPRGVRYLRVLNPSR